jgi:hypothetical protein
MKRSISILGLVTLLFVLLAVMSSPSSATETTGTGAPDWEELVGKTGVEVEEFIRKQRPDVKTAIIPDGTPVTQDFKPSRVRIFVDANNKVIRRPVFG